MRRFNNLYSKVVKTERAFYLVALEKIKNDINGNPRYKAYMTVVEVFGELTTADRLTAVYTLGGYAGEQELAEKVVSEYEKGVKA